MKKILTLLAAAVWALTASSFASASEPDAPGTKLITIQAGGLPGFGGLVSGQIAMANFASGHLYGGLQLGANSRHGAVTGTNKMDLSVAPRLMLGWNLGRVFEIHLGGQAGIVAQRFDADKMQLAFGYGGFGGFRFNVSDSFGLVLEGSYSNCLPYATGGIAFRF